MKDSIIAGSGNSRYLKSAVPAGTSWGVALEMLRNGTFPIDLFGVNASGFEQMGTPLNTTAMLPDALAARLSLTPSATLAQFLDALTTLAKNAVSSTGDGTIAGKLTLQDVLEIINAGTAAINFSSANQTVTGSMFLAANRRIGFDEFGSGSEATAPETYRLPSPAGNMTTRAYYDILTSKAAVTPAQGGTGETSALAGGAALLTAQATQDSDAEDTDYIVSQRGSAFYRRPLTRLWNWIKGKLAADASAARTNLGIRSGRVTGVSLAAGAQGSTAVTFDTAMPSNQYVVVVTIYGSFSAAANVHYSTGGQTATGFTMRYINTGSADQTGLIFDWIAVAI